MEGTFFLWTRGLPPVAPQERRVEGGIPSQTLIETPTEVADQTGAAQPDRPAIVVDAKRYDSVDFVWLDEVSRADARNVGDKASGLGELAGLGVAVPPGFVLTTHLFAHFLRANRIDRLIRSILTELNVHDTRALHEASLEIGRAILAGKIEPRLEDEITEGYQDLRLKPGGSLDVAVRPSIPPTEGKQALGYHTTLLHISGTRKLLEAIKAVWASLYSPRALYAHVGKSSTDASITAAILVQTMVAAEVAGVMTTIDTTTGDQSLMTVEAAWGLGQAVVRGLLTPDQYTLEKASGNVVERIVAEQAWKLGRDRLGGRIQHVPIEASLRAQPKLTDGQLSELGRLGQVIESHFQYPQNTEWAIAHNQIYFVQATPLPRIRRTLKVSVGPKTLPAGQAGETELAARTPIVHGTGASVGIASGPVRIIHGADDLSQVKTGDVVVTEITSPDFLPIMDRVAALVTDAGGRTSHAALLSHEFGIPVVVGAGNATHLLHEGQTVTVDGHSGNVYRGATHHSPLTTHHSGRPSGRPIRTATKILVNLARPERAAEVAKLGVDGVGLIRAEFMIASLGEHPHAMIDDGRGGEFSARLADGIETIARAFHPHPVVYRASDFKTNEYRALKGGDRYEPHEENPMLGFRGTARYVADPAVFQAELAALKEVRAHRGWDNVQLMLPFVRTVAELQKAKEYIAAAGLSAERTFKLRMMVEVPSNVFAINEFLAAGIDGISIGSNDLTQLILGVDRDTEQLKDTFNELDPAVVSAIRIVIRAARAAHVPVTVCGQAASDYPEFAEFLIHEGVTGLSVDPAAVDTVRQLVASVEHHLD